MLNMREAVGKAGRTWRDWIAVPWWFASPRGACAMCGKGFWRTWPWCCFEEFCSQACNDECNCAVDQYFDDLRKADDASRLL